MFFFSPFILRNLRSKCSKIGGLDVPEIFITASIKFYTYSINFATSMLYNFSIFQNLYIIIYVSKFPIFTLIIHDLVS
jgi:hypothetical protein